MAAPYLAPTRDPNPTELEWFRANPNIGGYAAPDDMIVVNPYNRLTPRENEALIRNESARIFMRRNPSARPSFSLTEEQAQMPYPAYDPPSRPEQSIRETVAGRMLSGDPSAGAVTDEQKLFLEELRARMMVK